MTKMMNSDEMKYAIEKMVGEAGLARERCRVASLLRVFGSVVDAVSGDIVLERGGLLAVVELNHLNEQEPTADPGDPEQSWPRLHTQTVVVACAHDLADDLQADDLQDVSTIWV